MAGGRTDKHSTLPAGALGGGRPAVAAGSGLAARPPEALCVPGRRRRQRAWGQHVAAESRVEPFHVAGGIPDWPVLRGNLFKFSLFLRRKHRPVTSTSAATPARRPPPAAQSSPH